MFILNYILSDLNIDYMIIMNYIVVYYSITWTLDNITIRNIHGKNSHLKMMNQKPSEIAYHRDFMNEDILMLGIGKCFNRHPCTRGDITAALYILAIDVSIHTPARGVTVVLRKLVILRVV